MKTSTLLFLIAVLSLSLAVIPAHASPAYVPHSGDYFNYHEVIDLNNAQGPVYAGYSEHQVIDGTETMTQYFSNNSTVATHYIYTYSFTNTTSTSNGGKTGDFTWSSSSFRYLRGNDSLPKGYVNPTVWFSMDNTTGTGGTFYLLNTQMTVKSTDNSYHLPAPENRNVRTLYAQGSSSYNRNDVYGQFLATYTWDAYFDPSTGYIVAYSYREHDSGFSGDSFDWTETLNVASTSYTLAPASFLSQYLGYIVAIVVVAVIVLIVVLAIWIRRRRNLLPKHPPPPPTYDQYARQPPPQAPPPSIDLTPKQQPPVQQIVVKEVVKVNCRYCGALIDSTAERCPFCGAPRT